MWRVSGCTLLQPDDVWRDARSYVARATILSIAAAGAKQYLQEQR